ncbi:hypothetical protein WJR50_06355 [Catalinimonas sp. 4WD22]|uniref:hypothetical protein n=1 Tax=Catalinimonas locisalis TaxID=3133978 RepID=UPI00310112CA
MKSSLIALAALAIFSFATVDASALPVNQDATTVFIQDSRTEIQYENLPEAVKTAFEESDYSEQEVTIVYQVQTEDGMQYELSITDGTDTITVTYDAEGNEIEA